MTSLFVDGMFRHRSSFSITQPSKPENVGYIHPSANWGKIDVTQVVNVYNSRQKLQYELANSNYYLKLITSWVSSPLIRIIDFTYFCLFLLHQPKIIRGDKMNLVCLQYSCWRWCVVYDHPLPFIHFRKFTRTMSEPFLHLIITSLVWQITWLPECIV